MSKSRQEWKVGIFVLIGLVLLGALLLQFSKGTTFFRKTYDILLRSPNVGGGLKVRASVLMAGVQVGTVNDIKLGPQGTNVTITLRIYGEYVIHKDARFYIEQSGFLGDQYVAILPTKNQGEVFVDQDIADAQTPMNVMEIARSAAGFLQNVDQMTTKLEGVIGQVQGVITNVNLHLLNSETLSNLATTAQNLRTISEQAGTTMDNVNALLATNAPVVNYAVSNLAGVTDRLGLIANGANDVVATNSPVINTSLKNIETSTEQLKAVMDDVRAGKGLAGKVLQDPQMAANIQQIAVNLSITTSNLNRLGLWGILWKKKTPPEHRPRVEEPLRSPKESAQ